jgi:hypothetical protein
MKNEVSIIMTSSPIWIHPDSIVIRTALESIISWIISPSSSGPGTINSNSTYSSAIVSKIPHLIIIFDGYKAILPNTETETESGGRVTPRRQKDVPKPSNLETSETSEEIANINNVKLINSKSEFKVCKIAESESRAYEQYKEEMSELIISIWPSLSVSAVNGTGKGQEPSESNIIIKSSSYPLETWPFTKKNTIKIKSFYNKNISNPQSNPELNEQQQPQVTFLEVQGERLGQALALKEALNYVNTPYFLSTQHDWAFLPPIPRILSFLELMDSDLTMNYIGFLSRNSKRYAHCKAGNARGLPTAFLQEEDSKIYKEVGGQPLCRAFFWWDKVWLHLFHQRIDSGKFLESYCKNKLLSRSHV